MTIISPLQGKKEAIGVNLASVIEERIKEDVSLKEIKNALVNNKKITEHAQMITESYTSSTMSKVELHKCRLRAQIYKRSFGKYADMGCTHDYIGEDVSGDIIDGRDQNVGSFDLQSMSSFPRCCATGEWKIILVSKYKTASVVGNVLPVVPVFIVVDQSAVRGISRHSRQKAESYFSNFGYSFNPIDASTITTHHGAFSFKVPPQTHDMVDQLYRMKKSGKKLKLALYRSIDGMFSATSFDFDYYHCFNACPYCIVREGGSQEDQMNQNGKRLRENHSPMRNAQHQQDGSPDSAYPSSPNTSEKDQREQGLGTVDFDDLSDDSDQDDYMQGQQKDSVEDLVPLNEGQTGVKIDGNQNMPEEKNDKPSDAAENMVTDCCKKDNSSAKETLPHCEENTDDQGGENKNMTEKGDPKQLEKDGSKNNKSSFKDAEKNDSDEEDYLDDGSSTNDDSSTGGTSDENEDNDDNHSDVPKVFDRAIKDDHTANQNETIQKWMDATPGTEENNFQEPNACLNDPLKSSVSQQAYLPEQKKKKDDAELEERDTVAVHTKTPWVYVMYMVLCIMLGWLIGYFSRPYDEAISFSFVVLVLGLVFQLYSSLKH